MEGSATGLNSASGRRFLSKVKFAGVSRGPGGQTAQAFLGQFISKVGNTLLENKTASTEGFVLDGYYLGTFEFDSLTGHPGIRY